MCTIKILEEGAGVVDGDEGLMENAPRGGGFSKNLLLGAWHAKLQN